MTIETVHISQIRDLNSTIQKKLNQHFVKNRKIFQNSIFNIIKNTFINMLENTTFNNF